MITVAFADNVHHVKNGSAVEILDEDAMVFALIFVYAVCARGPFLGRALFMREYARPHLGMPKEREGPCEPDTLPGVFCNKNF